MKHLHSFDTFRINESLQLNEKFVDANGNTMDQKDIVKRVHDALIWSKGDYETFKKGMSSTKEIKGPGITAWKTEYESVPITDEKVIKKMFDTYRPVSMLNEKAFGWLIDRVYEIVNGPKRMPNAFNVSVKNQLSFKVALQGISELAPGKITFIDSGPFAYKHSQGWYYNTADSVKDLGIGRDKPVNLEIVIMQNLWTLEAKTPEGTKVLEKLLNNRKAFDTYSGWYEGDKFCFILYKFDAPKPQLKPQERDKV